MKFKKLMTFALAAFMLAGCAPKQQQNTTKLKIVATTFPQYDWIREVIGKDNKNVDLQLLMKNGGDLHSYQPTAGDIANISDANLFVYVGGESDEWVDDALKEKTNKDMKVVNMMQTLGDDIDEEEEGLEKKVKTMITIMMIKIMTMTMKKLNMMNMFGYHSNVHRKS